MSLFAASTWIAVASMAYSYYNQQQAKKAQAKARQEAEQRADLAKGFQFTTEGQAKSLPVLYGRNKVGGVRVHFKVTDAYNFADVAPGGISFESKKQPDNSPPAVYKLVNTNSDWTGTWSLVESTTEDFNNHPGWVVTKEDLAAWKYPDRIFENESISYGAPSVDYIFCPFKFGTDTGTKPPASVRALGFEFPERAGTEMVLNTSRSGEKNEFFFVQQAIAHASINEVYTFDVDQKPYTFSGYSYGLRAHIYKNGSVADPLMVANDATRAQARFSKTAYASMCFKLNRDDPQYNGTPDVQFYVEGTKVRTVEKAGSAYTVSANKIYSNNSALVLLDYLTDTAYGKGLSYSNIDLESIYKAAKICDILVKSNITKKGALWLSKGGNRDVRLYECNIALDTGSSFRDNIQKILDSMGLATLVWSEGKYRLNLPYAFLYEAGRQYYTDEIVQITVNNENRLYRCVQNALNKDPVTSPTFWAEDVIDDDLKRINDDDLLNGDELLISWPNSETKLNFATVRYLNEDKDFSEDTVSWPEKEPTNGNDTVYSSFIAEDNNVPLEAEIFEAGCTTEYHAKALAEQRVRASRATVTYTFKAVARVFKLEPGDVFGFESKTFKIPYVLLKVDDIETEEGGVVKVTASTFDANLFAWNVPDDYYVPLVDNYEGYVIKQAKNLRMVVGETSNKTSNYTLHWDKASDNRVNRYIVRYTKDSIANVTSSSAWRDLGTTYADSFELPALDGDFTFTVVSLSRDGRPAPFKNLAEGSTWPLISYQLSSSFLDGFNALTANLSNDTHVLFANSAGVVTTYAGSGTEINVYAGSTPLVYNGVGTTPGTFKVATTGVTNITCGTISQKPNDVTTALVNSHTNLTATTAQITYVITGTTVAGATFTINKTQSLSKVSAGDNAKYVYIGLSANVIFKDAASAALTGIHSSVTATGKMVVGASTSNYGFLTVTPNNGTESSAVEGSITINPANDAGTTKYTIKLYDTAAKTTLLDTEEIPVVFKGDKGSGAINAFMSNGVHAFPADSAGNVLSYANSGTDVFVYEGGSRLAYNPSWAGENGQWKVTISSSNIAISSSVVDVGDFVRIGDHTAMTSETAAVSYTIMGKTSEGVPFETYLTQTLLKARRGETVIDAYLTNAAYAFVTDENGTITSYAGTGTQISCYEGNSKIVYDGVGVNPGTWRVTASGSNITPAALNTFTVVDSNTANIPVASNMAADTATITFTITGKSTTGTAFTLTKTQQFTKNKQGVTGKKSAVVNLYVWSTATPPTPIGSSVFTWSGLTNTNYTSSGESTPWSTTVPTNPGTPLLKLWVATKRIEAVNTATTTSVYWTSSSVGAMSQNGQAGVNVATATMYKWAITIPSAPSGSNTWTWASNDFDSINASNASAGWSKVIPTPTAGMTLWAAEVKLMDSAVNATTAINWVVANIAAKSYAGTNGATGQQGASYRTAFTASQVPTATYQNIVTVGASSLPPVSSFGLTNATWSANAPAINAGEYLWQSDGIYDPVTNNVTWTTPYWSSLKVGNLSAISANMGTVTAGILRNSSGTFEINLDAGTITIAV
jgi:hypothetical protein